MYSWKKDESLDKLRAKVEQLVAEESEPGDVTVEGRDDVEPSDVSPEIDGADADDNSGLEEQDAAGNDPAPESGQCGCDERAEYAQ